MVRLLLLFMCEEPIMLFVGDRKDLCPDLHYLHFQQYL